MTLLVALRGTDGLVVAADSRVTLGDPRGVTAQNDSMQKAFVLSRRVAALQAGAGEVGSLIRQEASALLAKDDGINEVLDKLRNHVRQCYGEWFPSVAAIPARAASGQAPTRPDLVTLSDLARQVGERRVLVLRAGLAEVAEQLDAGVLRHAGHSHRGADTHAFDEASDHLRSLLGAQPVHTGQST